MLVGAYDGGVDDQIFKVRTFYQRIEDTFPNALLGPAAKALENTVPVAKQWRQIAPGCTRTRDPEHRIDKQTIVLAVPAFVTFLTRNKPLDAQPLRIRQFLAESRSTSSVAILNHIRESVGIPYMSTGPSHVHDGSK